MSEEAPAKESGETAEASPASGEKRNLEESKSTDQNASEKEEKEKETQTTSPEEPPASKKVKKPLPPTPSPELIVYSTETCKEKSRHSEFADIVKELTDRGVTYERWKSSEELGWGADDEEVLKGFATLSPLFLTSTSPCTKHTQLTTKRWSVVRRRIPS